MSDSIRMNEGPVQRGNGNGGPTTPKPVILPKGQASSIGCSSLQTIPSFPGSVRTALAEQQKMPSEEEIDKLFDDNCYPDDFGTCLMIKEEFRDAVYIALSRWGHQPTPPAELLADLND